MTTKNLIALSVLLFSTRAAWADEVPDSLKVVDLEEVTVIAAPKENTKLREQPLSSTLLSQDDMRANQINSVKNLSGIVPNLFIPNYGSRLTTSIYIRGIGSRANTPSVGLYVDNVPFIEKSAFDFDYYDIERIDVLRGPQGTLYGRNTMGGLIKIHTKSPFNYQGTDVILGAATYGSYKASVTRYHRLSDKFAFSAGGFYDHADGFFKNRFNDKRVDKSNAGGGRIRAIYLPTPNLKIDAGVTYNYSDQGGYPYEYTGVVAGKDETLPDMIGQINYNRPSSYRRGLLNTGLTVEYQARHFILSSVTGYQNLNDRMFLDQDFSYKDIYTLCQKQRSNTLSEELVLKSKPGTNWQWVTGAFGFYQWLHTNAPVTFGEEGVKEMIEGNANKVFANLTGGNPNAPAMQMTVNNKQLNIPGTFDTPVMNGAIYHQSTYNNLFVRGLSFTVGLRLDYEKMKLRYNSSSDPMNFGFTVSMPAMGPRPPMNIPNSQPLYANASFEGRQSTDYLQLLPRFALQYEWKVGNNVYATVSKGYRSGGYNIQGFSDLIQQTLSNSSMDALAGDPSFASMGQMITSQKKPVTDVREATVYKPEYTWSYEAGTHLTLLKNRLWADLSAFYMDTRNQQITEFTESGLGRTTINAGKSRSYGAEASLRASVTNSLTLQASYGYTYATFTDYVAREKDGNGKLVDVSYNGKYVPFVPKHTMSIGGEYALAFRRSVVDRLVLQANYNAAGRIYWTEQNNVSQAFYGLLNWRLSAEIGKGSISLWARNTLNHDYTAFYFETMSKGFKQCGNPAQFGIELRCRF
ncbi:MAG: TonB-dependent receptor [Mediterranea sp.]|jgi:outer membrane receptor protein involved in Fe transport|nr:TonB-dependent receptor [Mediterranea sp.]